MTPSHTVLVLTPETQTLLLSNMGAARNPQPASQTGKSGWVLILKLMKKDTIP